MLSFGLRAETLPAAKAGFPALESPRGARALALGGAYAGLAADGGAVGINPACLALIRENTFSFSHESAGLGAYAETASLGGNLEGFSGWGGEITYLGYGDFEKRGNNGELLEGTISPNALAGRLGLGRAFLTNRLGVGASLGVLEQTVVSKTQAAFDANIGALWVADSGLRFALGVAALGGGLGETLLPTRVYLGGVKHWAPGPGHAFLLALQAEDANSYPGSASAGLEYQWNKLLSLRAGWQVRFEEQTLSGLQGLSLGVGLGSDWGRLDYGMNFNGELGQVHCLSLALYMGK
jgi:hypothetical protein